MREPGPAGVGARVSVRGLSVRFGDVPAVRDLDLDLAPGSFTALLGPSGCGKSTTLAALAGLVRPAAGDVRLDDVSVLDVPPERRPVSLVLQKPLLFPHLDVAQNVGFGLRMARVPRAAIREQVEQMLSRVRLEGLGGRRPGELSGGQEQRVSLARALVRRPRVLLLDEPFSQLDPELRSEMRALLRELHDEHPVTTVFVTHDREEAVETADRIELLLAGTGAGAGTPLEVYTRPATLALADFFGWTGRWPGRVEAGRFVSDDGALDVPADPAGGRQVVRGRAVLVARPEAVELGGPDLRLPVVATRFAGTHVVVELSLPHGHALLAHVPVGTAPAVGELVGVRLAPQGYAVLEAGP